MDCSVPVVPSPAAPAITASGGSGLAVTGSPLDVILACAIALVLLAGGVMALARSRRRRREAPPSSTAAAPGVGLALSSVLGVILLLGAFSPSQAAHAAPEQCDVISVSDVQIDATVLAGGVIQLVPGGQPAVVRASVTNSTTVPVTLTAIARTDNAVPLATQIVWKSESSSGSAVESSLGDSDSHSLGTLAPGESTTVTFTVNLPASVGNEYQGQTVPLSLVVQAVQQGF